FLGVAGGGVSIVSPMYIAEVVPPALRGRLVSLNTLMIVVGQLAAYVVHSALATLESWEWMVGLAAVPRAMLFVGMLFVPDSPAWLVPQGRKIEAEKVAARLGVRLEELTPAESTRGAATE